jgi:hypothetical protein
LATAQWGTVVNAGGAELIWNKGFAIGALVLSGGLEWPKVRPPGLSSEVANRGLAAACNEGAFGSSWPRHDRRSQSEALFYVTRSRILFAFKYFPRPAACHCNDHFSD